MCWVGWVTGAANVLTGIPGLPMADVMTGLGFAIASRSPMEPEHETDPPPIPSDFLRSIESEVAQSARTGDTDHPPAACLLTVHRGNCHVPSSVRG
jgi:hypothetical protein